jgi:apolipoprotein D and lipocalin family protein
LLVPPPLVGACKTGNFSTVDIDMKAFQGAWYEHAHSASFLWDKGCVCTTAEYTPLADGTLRVLNTCRKHSAEAPIFQKEARARLIGPGHLKVNFFAGLPFADADYRVVWVDEGYDNAIIVSCSQLGGSLIWFIGRQPYMDEETFLKRQRQVEDMGFVTTDLVRSQQMGCWSFETAKSAVIRREVGSFSEAVPKACALPSKIKNFPYQELESRWHILYTQPDFVENIFSKNCLCNTVTLEASSKINGGQYPGTWRASVVCRNAARDGPRSDFVRPVYQISNLTSYLGHFTQKLWGGVANEHWQVLAHADDFDHMLLYTCLDTKLFGKTYCLHIVGRRRTVEQEVVDEYIRVAKEMNLYRPDVWHPVDHGEGCIYDGPPLFVKQE